MEQTVKQAGEMQKQISKGRNSNLELLRIVSMLFIIAHHFVVNSGIPGYYDFSNVTPNMIFLQLWGMWGKTAINIFVLISGYFMCTGKLTVKRFCKIYLEAKFYQVLIFLIFLVAGYETISATSLFNLAFGFLRFGNDGFTASFLLFYLFVPFYNILISCMNQRQHKWLVILSLMFFSVAPTFLLYNKVFHEPLWYMVLYFVAAYIRLYPADWMTNNKICSGTLFLTLLLAYTSVLVVDFVGVRFGFKSYYHMVSNSNQLFAVIIGVLMFLSFRNLKMRNRKWINSVAATCFGVLCIHASSDAMRKFLWQDLLDVAGHYESPLLRLIVFSAASVMGVFIACSLLDMFRIQLIEKPVFRWLDRFAWFQKELY